MNYKEYKETYGMVDTSLGGCWQTVTLNCLKCGEANNVEVNIDLEQEGALPDAYDCGSCGAPHHIAYEVNPKIHIELASNEKA